MSPGFQLASPYTRWPANETSLVVEPLLEGTRAQIILCPQVGGYMRHPTGRVSPRSDRVQNLVAEAMDVFGAGWVLDGMLSECGNHFTAFDLLALQHQYAERKIKSRSRSTTAMYEVSQAARTAKLLVSLCQHTGNIAAVETWLVRTQKDILALLSDLVGWRGHAGVMLKLIDAPYVFGRSPYWLELIPTDAGSATVTGIMQY